MQGCVCVCVPFSFAVANCSWCTLPCVSSFMFVPGRGSFVGGAVDWWACWTLLLRPREHAAFFPMGVACLALPDNDLWL